MLLLLEMPYIDFAQETAWEQHSTYKKEQMFLYLLVNRFLKNLILGKGVKVYLLHIQMFWCCKLIKTKDNYNNAWWDAFYVCLCKLRKVLNNLENLAACLPRLNYISSFISRILTRSHGKAAVLQSNYIS